MTQLSLNLAEGRRKRNEGASQVVEHNSELFERLLSFAKEHSRTFGSVTADDVRVHASLNNWYPKHRNFYGAIFVVKGWKFLDYKASARPEARGRKIGIFKWEDKSA